MHAAIDGPPPTSLARSRTRTRVTAQVSNALVKNGVIKSQATSDIVSQARPAPRPAPRRSGPTRNSVPRDSLRAQSLRAAPRGAHAHAPKQMSCALDRTMPAPRGGSPGALRYALLHLPLPPPVDYICAGTGLPPTPPAHPAAAAFP